MGSMGKGISATVKYFSFQIKSEMKINLVVNFRASHS